MVYELLCRNKFLTIDAKSLEDMIGLLADHVAFLKELQATGKVKLGYGADDDHATLVTTDPDLAEKYGFDVPWDEDSDELEDESGEDSVD